MSKEKVTETEINLFEEFPSIDAEEWKKQIEADLPGVDYDKKLVWKTYEGFNVEPFYTEKDLENLFYLTDSFPGEYPFVRGKVQGQNGWEICEEVTADNINKSNSRAREALNNGADSLTYTGLSASTAVELPELISDIPLVEKKLNFVIDLDTLDIFDSLIAEALSRNVEPSKLSGAFYLSPLNDLFLKGSKPFDIDQCFQKIKDFITHIDSVAPEYKALSVKSDSFSASGSNIVQEIAFSLAMGCEYLVKLIEKGLSPDTVTKKLVFQFSVSSDYFMEIAKLRAVRLLWAEIVDKLTPAERSSCEMTIHCKTGGGSNSHDDPYKKMLSDTVESMAATVGGCDTLTVLPYDSVNESGKEYSDRLARNTQLVLKEEAYMHKVTDPGSGSYYIEKLTDVLANEALKLFQVVERNGGFIKCIENSFIQDQISEVRNSAKNTD